MQTIEELRRRPSDVPDLDDAVAGLVGDGLANRVGDLAVSGTQLSREPSNSDETPRFAGFREYRHGIRNPPRAALGRRFWLYCATFNRSGTALDRSASDRDCRATVARSPSGAGSPVAPSR